MALSAGERLGPYQILAPLGAGGMGEVYRARDTKLDRDVAIKVVPAALAHHPDRMARFEREAKVLAALNHPNIAVIYGLEDRAIVMELVEGPTLADRLKAGAIPLEESLKIALQIADALEAAHEKGVVHRDLKPANVKVREDGTVKVLDFGLATAVASARESGDGQSSPTLTMGATEAGVILGTAAYMAPEQARGQKVDKRADIWAFGVVLYEMVTGARMYEGATVSDVLAHVLTKQPDLDRAPAKVRRLLRRCLEKDPKQRLRDIGEARFLLEEVEQVQALPGSRGMAPRHSWAWQAVAAGFAIVAAGLGYVAWRHFTEEPRRVAKLSVLPPEKGEFFAIQNPPAVSPDGRHIVFAASVEGKRALWVRDLDSTIPRLLAGTENAVHPFWSPASRYVGFGTGGKLKKIDVSGGPAVTICDAIALRGASWSKDDVIVFAPNNNVGLARVSAAGGTPTPVTELDKARNENSHRYPWFLPDGRHFLYPGRSADPEKSAIIVGDLESKERKQLVPASNDAMYAAPAGGRKGYLLFLRDRTLMAQPFDAAKIALTGEPVPVAEQVDLFTNNHGMFSVSQNGVLVYTSGSGGTGNVQITWFDRAGKEAGTVGTPGDMQWALFSPDGATVAADRLDPQSGLRDLWLYDLARGTASRLTFAGSSQFPIWSPEGTRIVFLGSRGGTQALYLKPANGTGQEEVFESSANRRPVDWSRDGRYVIAETSTGDIWIHPQFGDKKPFAYLNSEFNEQYAKLSPDGRWLAYHSNESKRNEIYVVSFPAREGKWQISTNGGTIPVWSHDGRELYFISGDNKMMAVEIKALGGKFEASVPKPLFDVRPLAANANFDVSKDGRFLIPAVVEQAASVPMTVVLNWK